MNKQVEKYIQNQKPPQKEIIQKLRELILETVPNIKEEFKMGVPWYEGKFYMVAFKDHVNLGFCVNGLTEQQMAPFEGKGKFMRHTKFHTPQEINHEKLTKMLKLVAENTNC